MGNAAKRALVIILALCGTMQAQGYSGGWIFIAEDETREFTYEMKPKTAELTLNAIAVIGKVDPKTVGSDVYLQKWKVHNKDCTAEYGTLYVYALDGSLLNKFSFAFGSKTVASEVAEAVCNLRNKSMTR